MKSHVFLQLEKSQIKKNLKFHLEFNLNNFQERKNENFLD